MTTVERDQVVREDFKGLSVPESLFLFVQQSTGILILIGYRTSKAIILDVLLQFVECPHMAYISLPARESYLALE